VHDGESGIVKLRGGDDRGDVQVHDDVADCFVGDEGVTRGVGGVFEGRGTEVEGVEVVVVEETYDLERLGRLARVDESRVGI
jgi:hypothetical protein